MLTLGIDLEGGTWRVAAWNEDRAADLRTFASSHGVWEFVEEVLAAHPGTPMVLPSGFGIPLTRARDLMDQDIAEVTLQRDAHAAGGLGGFLAEARRRPLRAFCIPSVKLLPSVPLHRKLDRVDLGTADVLCAAAWALHAGAEAGRAPLAADLLLVHAASAAAALAVVRSGRLVDGVGGTADGPHALAGLPPGLLPRHSPPTDPGASPGWPEGAVPSLPGARRLRCQEALLKAVAALRGFHGDLGVVVTGAGRAAATQALQDRVPILPLAPSVDGYEAALGGAIIAAGLTGGPTAALVEHLGIRQARERVLDWLP